jgi:hypothetical protein
MLEKVRKVKAILTLDDVFQEGEIFFEFFDYPNHFYKEDDIKDFINIKTICEYGPFEMWFEELKPVEKEKTPQYKLILNNNYI